MSIQILLALLLFQCGFACYPGRALVVIDVQKCFIGGGNLAVPSGDDVIPVINEIREKYGNKFHYVYFSLDYHPANHISFASQHPGKHPLESVTLKYNEKAEVCKPTTWKNRTGRAVECDKIYLVMEQVLWPDHCVSGTEEVNLADDLIIDATRDKFIYKGTNPSVDSYSAFFENGHLSETNLHNLLQCDKIDELFVVGIATDFCVKWTALDGVELDYEVYVIREATRGTTLNNTKSALEEMSTKGVNVINLKELEKILG